MQILEHHNIRVGLDILCIKLKHNSYCATGTLRGECGFRAHLLTGNFKRIACRFVHKHTLDNVLLARHQMGVFHCIFQGEDFGGVDFLFTADGCSRAEFRDAVINNSDFNNLFVPLHLHMMHVGIGQIALGRLQLSHDPVAQRDILKAEHAIFV